LHGLLFNPEDGGDIFLRNITVLFQKIELPVGNDLKRRVRDPRNVLFPNLPGENE
jgi:hypothetical protein